MFIGVRSIILLRNEVVYKVSQYFNPSTILMCVPNVSYFGDRLIQADVILIAFSL